MEVNVKNDIPVKDYSNFMDTNFDVKEWVNKVFHQPKEPGVANDQHATTTVMKLQVFVQEVNSMLEEASHQAFLNLSWTSRELDTVKQEAVLLREQMRSVKQDIENVDSNTGQSMQALLSLDTVKCRMQTAADALQEADNWMTLSAEMEGLFLSQNIDQIAERILRMQQCLQTLTGTHDHSAKCDHLELLRNRLEALLSPQLIDAFNSQSVEKAQRFTAMFEHMDRLKQVYMYYSKSHKARILQSWMAICDTDSSLDKHLRDLYDLLQSTWCTQVKWTQNVFTEPAPVVVDTLSGALVSLEPSLLSCFDIYLGKSSDTLDSLCCLKQITDNFFNSMEKTVCAYIADGSEDAGKYEYFTKVVYHPYRAYLSKYAQLEEASLQRKLDCIKLDHEEIFDTVQLLSESVALIISAANVSHERCLRVSDGCCFLGLLQALTAFFSGYTREFRRVLVNVREKFRTGQAEYDNWSDFQHALWIVETFGCLAVQVEDIDRRLIDSALKHLTPLLLANRSHIPSCAGVRPPYFHASLFLGDSEDVETLRLFVSRLEAGDLASAVPGVISDIGRLSDEVHASAFDVLFTPLRSYLAQVPAMTIWSALSSGGALTSDLPTFSLAPQEYITKIGQYLMTLPQHLEPYSSAGPDSLSISATLHGVKLPYIKDGEQATPEHFTDLWLHSVALGVAHVFLEQTLRIPRLTYHGSKQLAIDIEYLRNVLDDLDLPVSKTLTHVESLLWSDDGHFYDNVGGIPRQLVDKMAAIRGIEQPT